MRSRRAYLDIVYEGVNISKEIAEDLMTFSHNDNAHGTADDIAITLKDREEKWINAWFPEKGDKIKVILNLENWDGDNQKESLDLGVFVVDEPSYSISPSQLSLNAISTPSNGNFTDSPVNKGWNKITLKSLFEQIASKNNLTLLFDAQSGITIDRIDQNELSDMNFISDVCGKYGLNYKVSDTKIIIYDEKTYEKKPPILTISKHNVISGQLNCKPTFTGVKVTYSDPASGQNISYTFGKTDKLFSLNQSVKSQSEAEQVAKAKLRELNREGFTAQITVVGTLKIMAATVIQLKDFGRFDGNYFVDKVSQTLPNFTLSIETHKVLEGDY